MQRHSLDIWIAMALLAVSIGHFIWLFSFADNGFDLSDEAINVLPAMFPDHQSGQLTLFGYLTQFLWTLSGSSIPLFRILGMGIFSCWVLTAAARVVVYTRSTRLGSGKSFPLFVFAAAIGSIPFFYRDLYVLSPGYNWLVMIGLLAVQFGFFLLWAGRSAAAVTVSFGVGGFLAFAGKPTSGFAILILLFLTCMLMGAPRRSFGVLARGVLLAGVLCVACTLWLGGGIVETFYKFSFAMDYFRLAETGHTLWNTFSLLLESLVITPWKVFLFTQKFTLAATLAAAIAAWRFKWRFRYSVACILVLSALELSLHDISYNTYNFYLVSSFIMTLLAAIFVFRFSEPATKFGVPAAAALVPLLFGVFVAISHVFGTNNGPGGKLLLPTVAIVLPLMLVGAWSEFRLRQRGIVATLAAATVFSGGVLLHRSAADPVDVEGGISAQTEPVTFRNQSGVIKLDPARAAYARAMLQAAASEGWRDGTPLLNLTGHSPGANVILDAPFVALPMLLGRTDEREADEAALRFVLRHTSAKVASAAWIITSNGKRRLDPRIVRWGGLQFPCSYRLVATFPSYENSEYSGGPLDVHQLWRPNVAATCPGSQVENKPQTVRDAVPAEESVATVNLHPVSEARA